MATVKKVRSYKKRNRKIVVTNPCGSVVVITPESRHGNLFVAVCAPAGSTIRIDEQKSTA